MLTPEEEAELEQRFERVRATNPVVHACIMMMDLTQKQAFKLAIVTLAEQNKTLIDAEVERQIRKPPEMFTGILR